MDNHSSISEFLLLEFSPIWEIWILHFILFLVFYLTTVAGNFLIILAVALDHHLHSPLYFFLMNLAIQDLGSVSVTIPKYIISSFIDDRHISYSGCVAQVFLFAFFAGCDVALLIVMAYDRYVAICNPLQYETLMNRKTCMQMAVSAWLAGFLNAVVHTAGTFVTPFCSNVVNQFFCEIPQLLKLACSDSYQIEMGAVWFGLMLWSGCFIFIIVTYVQIFTVVLKIPSVQRRKKAFSTCIPHLIVVSIFSLTVSLAHLRPTSGTSSPMELLLTIMYSVLPPMLNPLIYSLRNQEIKLALSRILTMRSFQQGFLCYSSISVCHVVFLFILE
ncbi:olfactory receptor 14A16 [Anolis carolinensis]|uniref:Olfactory receptor n=3 Tax=Anolis carolinensis TaxID=28377 RepID=H9GGY8_ANOCA|nr:PREDICTED: olfactory receptor 14A16-like [Anolis carolinensis]|eukprot:XP_003224613.1 PREDICTED: olfactory receptor 14A16-like [Anolis carolinensis]